MNIAKQKLRIFAVPLQVQEYLGYYNSCWLKEPPRGPAGPSREEPRRQGDGRRALCADCSGVVPLGRCPGQWSGPAAADGLDFGERQP